MSYRIGFPRKRNIYQLGSVKFDVTCPICSNYIVTKEKYDIIVKNNLKPPNLNLIHEFKCDELMKDNGYSFDKNFKIIDKKKFMLEKDLESENIYIIKNCNYYNTVIIGNVKCFKIDNKVHVKLDSSIHKKYNDIIEKLILEQLNCNEIVYENND